jgi:hypothetical protein
MHTTLETFDFDEEQFQQEAANIVEALVNLTYLICEEADHPGKVRQYANMSDERLVAMTQLLRRRFQKVSRVVDRPN